MSWNKIVDVGAVGNGSGNVDKKAAADVPDALNLAPEGSHPFASLADGRPIVAAWRREVRALREGWAPIACYAWTLSIGGQPFVALQGATAEPFDLAWVDTWLARPNPGLAAVRQPDGHERLVLAIHDASHHGSVSGTVLLDFDLAARVVRCQETVQVYID